MLDRRFEYRLLCSDLVNLQWSDECGKKIRVVANLEDISLTGACLQVDTAISLGTKVRMTCPKGEFVGAVRYCVFREMSYQLGIEFDPNSQWSQRLYRPQHLLDPRRLARPAVRTRGAKKHPNYSGT